MTGPHTQILRLARSGSLERAWALMEQHGLLDSDTDVRALTLQGRLVKDRAKRAEGAERARLFGDAAALYAKAGSIGQGSYPLINAASLALLAGQKAQSEKLAGSVLSALEDNPDEAETPYWLGATRAEALLLLGKEPEARAALRQAVLKQPAAFEDHAATLGQFELLCAELGFDAGWLEQIRPPRSVHFAGIMNVAADDDAAQNQISAWLERENIGFGYGALAAGSDIWIAEALLERGAEIHVVLPCAEAKFRDASVSEFGEHWLPRFDTLMAAASSVHSLQFTDGPGPSAVALAEAVARGMARQNAQLLRTGQRSLRIVGQGDSLGQAADGGSYISANRLSTNKTERADEAMSFLLQTADGVVAHSNANDARKALFNAEGRRAIACVPVEEAEISPKTLQQLGAMFDCAESGQANASLEAAFALLDSDASVHIGGAGDMRWAGGLSPLYHVS